MTFLEAARAIMHALTEDDVDAIQQRVTDTALNEKTLAQWELDALRVLAESRKGKVAR